MNDVSRDHTRTSWTPEPTSGRFRCFSFLGSVTLFGVDLAVAEDDSSAPVQATVLGQTVW